MATIRLIPDKINAMPELIGGAGAAFSEMGESLFSLRDAALLISPEIISMDDVAGGAVEAAGFCGEVAESLSSFREEMEHFIQTVVEADTAAAELIEKRTEEFYKQYEHLRPECEKDFWDKAADWFRGAAEWCRENWKLIAVVVIAVAAIVACIFVPALAPLAGVVLKGMLSGAIMGGLTGGITNAISGGSFLEGFEAGAVDGALSGALMGGLGYAGGAAMTALGACGTKLSTIVPAAAKALSAVDTGLDVFDTAAVGLGYIAPGNWLTEFSNSLHSSETFNNIRFGLSMAAVFMGGAADSLNCFPAGTLVLTAAGLVAIEMIKAGDMVMASDCEGHVGFKRVVRTFAHPAGALVRVKVSPCCGGAAAVAVTGMGIPAEAGYGEIRCTPGHPFYVEGEGFVYAENLKTGSLLVTPEGKHVRIESVEADETASAENPTTVYNFEVEDWHTYFVGEWCVLVHNTCPLKQLDTGDLQVVRTLDPQDVNASFMADGYKAPYDASYEVKVVKAGDETYARVYTYKANGTSNMKGRWLMKKSDIEGLTAAEIREKFALPEEPTHICDVNPPPDFELRTGVCAEIDGFGKGGGQQFDTMGGRIDEDAFTNERLIEG